MARVLAYLCNYWGIDYKTEVPGHQDIQADKIDPGNLLEACGYSRNVKNLDKQIAKYINGVKPAPSKKLSTKQLKSRHLRHKVWLSINKQSNTCTA